MGEANVLYARLKNQIAAAVNAFPYLKFVSIESDSPRIPDPFHFDGTNILE